MTEPLRIAWLTTGRGPGSYGAFEYALHAIGAGLPVEIAVLAVNRARGEAEPTDRLMRLAEEHGVPVEAHSSVQFRKERGGRISKPGEPLPAWRTDFDRMLADRLAEYDFNLGVMFGYMLIATEPLFARFRLINDHPALPDGPVGTYQEVIRELMATRARESGCMMNVVTGDVDRGPAISYCRYSIADEGIEPLWREFEAADLATPTDYDATPLFAEIRRRGVVRERPFLTETLRAISEGRLDVPPPEPVDLTDAVEAALLQ